MKKGICIHYFSHRGIGKIVKETDDWKKDDKEMKEGKYDIYCHGCGPDMKTATKNYNIDIILIMYFNNGISFNNLIFLRIFSDIILVSIRGFYVFQKKILFSETH